MEITGGEIIRNELTKNAKGGTEQMAERLYNSLPKELLKPFQIICSRVRELDNSKIKILWCHDLAVDPEAKKVLEFGGHKKFDYIVFVSYWQRDQFIIWYNIPYSKTIVLQNAIEMFDEGYDESRVKNSIIKFIYHTTPHRGLKLLVPAFSALAEKYDNIHLDVYSSFSVYGWEGNDLPFSKLFDTIKTHPNMTYHGGVENSVVRTALSNADVYAYPCIHLETSCISLMEAMAAGVICIHPNYAALPETAAGCTMMYNYHEDEQQHLNIFYMQLIHLMENINKEHNIYDMKSQMAQEYATIFYNWNTRVAQWKAFLEMCLHRHNEKTSNETQEMFVYKA